MLTEKDSSRKCWTDNYPMVLMGIIIGIVLTVAVWYFSTGGKACMP